MNPTKAGYPLNISSVRDHVEGLSTAIVAVGNGARAATDATTELDGADFADLFTGISRDLDNKP